MKMNPIRRTRTLLILAAALATLAWGCDEGDGESRRVDAEADGIPALDDELGLDVVVSAPVGLPGLSLAAEDLSEAFARIKGVEVSERHVIERLEAADAAEVVVVTIDEAADAALGEQGFRISARDFGGGRSGLEVTARTERGAMYGLYDIVGELGVRYLHPEQSFYPSEPSLTLPRGAYSGAVEAPTFARRGFHEHTQHPTVMSDFLLRPEDAFRGYVSNYLRWLARNRQNVLTFHTLKTIDLDAWLPYIDGIADEADGLGIDLGAVLSIADQQQNNFKLIRDDVIDPATGEVAAGDVQIRDGIDRLFEADLDFLVLQIGTSEFTKPTDAEVLGWLQTAIDHIEATHEGKRLKTWIHIFCGLEADSGGYFYHLPLEADPRIGAWVHTTMFYTLEHPAPVYACETFAHQKEFMEAANGEREQIFFPESAWWLGFDNNMPLSLPLTGWSRAYDIQQVLPAYDVTGHVTFTTGREWGYWQYDHYLTQATWDAQMGWEDYLSWMAPAYGEVGAEAMATLEAWTALQVEHIYTENPQIYFYLAGELPQDEIGERAGILARSPKRSYQSIFDLNDADHAAWQASDLALLERMRDAYQAALDPLPAPDPAGSAQDAALYLELYNGLAIHVRRLEHAIDLYEGVSAARRWRLEQEAAATEGRAPDATLRMEAEADAKARLAAARERTALARARIAEVEPHYRYPFELLAEAKPESLTSYPYGYLEETSTAFFWTRRDDQLERFIERAFDESDDAWMIEPSALFLTDSRRTTMVEPNDPVAGAVISGFIPQLLFGLVDIDLGGGTMSLLLAEDHNTNELPDEGTEVRIDGVFEGTTWRGTRDEYRIEVRDTTDTPVGEIAILGAVFTLETEDNGAIITDLTRGDLVGEIESAALVGLITSIGGIDVDGAENLIKGVYEIPTEEALPARLPMHFRFTYIQGE